MGKSFVRSRKSYRKRIRTRSGRNVIAKKEDIKLKSAPRLQRKNSSKNLEKIFRQQIAPEIKRYIRKNKGTNQYIFRIQINKNLKGKQLKTFWSTRRREISLKHLMSEIEDIEKEFIESLDQYLKRKDLISITIPNLDFEVISSAKKARTTRRSKRQKRR